MIDLDTLISHNPLLLIAVTLVFAYLLGSIPSAYIIAKRVSGEDVTTHGTGNVGAMNVKRTTGSWGWFAVTMLADGLKGLLPVAVATVLAMGWEPCGGPGIVELTGSIEVDAHAFARALPQAAVLGAVLGHNYSAWLALIKKRFARTGKGLATGAGALLAYDWRYFLAVLVVGLTFIAITRYMMAGQVAGAVTLPIIAVVLGSSDWPFALLMGTLVYAAHHKRFVGMLRGNEPKLYIHDRQGPRG